MTTPPSQYPSATPKVLGERYAQLERRVEGLEKRLPGLSGVSSGGALASTLAAGIQLKWIEYDGNDAQTSVEAALKDRWVEVGFQPSMAIIAQLGPPYVGWGSKSSPVSGILGAIDAASWPSQTVEKPTVILFPAKDPYALYPAGCEPVKPEGTYNMSGTYEYDHDFDGSDAWTEMYFGSGATAIFGKAQICAAYDGKPFNMSGAIDVEFSNSTSTWGALEYAQAWMFISADDLPTPLVLTKNTRVSPTDPRYGILETNAYGDPSQLGFPSGPPVTDSSIPLASWPYYLGPNPLVPGTGPGTGFPGYGPQSVSFSGSSSNVSLVKTGKPLYVYFAVWTRFYSVVYLGLANPTNVAFTVKANTATATFD